ncbi:MAG: penicillin-binding transpeptidase domain-containing protein [Planctomycetota bacterium]
MWRRLVGTGRATRPEKLVIAEELQSHAVATISRERADSIVADPGRFPGVDVREGRRRAYAASAPVHLLGTRLAATGVDATRGADGIERIFDAHLAGVPGERVVRTDRDGGVARVEPVRDPLPGHDLVLTIDGGLQAAVAAACDELVDRGAAVVLDVDSGAVLAIASRPAFDAEAASARDTRFWDTIGGQDADPLFDRALNGRYRAGAAVAPFIVAAAVDAGVVGAESQFFCGSPGGEADDHPCPIVGETALGHGTVTLRDAISLPCVASLAALSDALAEKKREHPLAVFGFGDDYQTDLPHRAAGVLSTARTDGSQDSRFRHRLGTSRVTPLEMARAAAALAGGGRLPTPHVVRGLGVRAAAGTRATVPAVTPSRTAVDPLAAATALSGMRAAVEDPAGSTHGLAAVSSAAVAAIGGHVVDAASVHDWAIAAWPADGPTRVIAVVVEDVRPGMAERVAGRVITADTSADD